MVLRWVDEELVVHEDFVGLHEVPCIQASTLVHVVKDTLLRLNLTLTKARGQCYDGASNMSGVRNGVAKQIQDEQPNAFFTHCYGHSLNLAVSDTIKQCNTMKSALEITHEITKLIKYSPRRERIFKDLKGEMAPGSPGVRVLCPTRWTVRADSMLSIIQNYSVLQELWDKAVDIVRDSDTIARIRGVSAQMQSFNFFFGLVLGECLLRNTDNLSRTLQKKDFSAAEGQITMEQTKRTLMSIRSDTSFDLFWEKVTSMASDSDVNDPVLPRRRKVPRRFEEGSAPPEYPSTPKDMYRKVYFEALDLLVQTIQDRFDQPGYKMYRCIEALLLKACHKKDYSEELKQVLEVYSADLNAPNLQTHIDIFSKNLSDSVTMSNIFAFKILLEQRRS